METVGPTGPPGGWRREGNSRYLRGMDAHDFGADEIKVEPDWRDSGYDHYTAYTTDGSGGQISWNEIQDENGERQVEDIHPSSRNIRKK